MPSTKTVPAPLTRTLAAVAREVGADWPAMTRATTVTPFGNVGEHPAHPYYAVMRTLHTTDLSDDYGCDTADGIVRYFLSNAGSWRGAVAQRVKAELKSALLHHDIGSHAPTDLIPRRRV